MSQGDILKPISLRILRYVHKKMNNGGVKLSEEGARSTAWELLGILTALPASLVSGRAGASLTLHVKGDWHSVLKVWIGALRTADKLKTAELLQAFCAHKDSSLITVTED